LSTFHISPFAAPEPRAITVFSPQHSFVQLLPLSAYNTNQHVLPNLATVTNPAQPHAPTNQLVPSEALTEAFCLECQNQSTESFPYATTPTSIPSLYNRADPTSP